MSNPFKYFKDKVEIWADIDKPNRLDFSRGIKVAHIYEECVREWESRPHFTVSPEPDWEDGKIVYEGIDYRIGDGETENEYYPNGDFTGVKKIKQIAIPLPKEPEENTYFDSTLKESQYITKPNQFKPEQQDIPMVNRILQKLIDEFDNPDNHGHQRNAIEDAKVWLKHHSKSPKEEKES